jgi:hypothetical protein
LLNIGNLSNILHGLYLKSEVIHFNILSKCVHFCKHEQEAGILPHSNKQCIVSGGESGPNILKLLKYWTCNNIKLIGCSNCVICHEKYNTRTMQKIPSDNILHVCVFFVCFCSVYYQHVFCMHINNFSTESCLSRQPMLITTTEYNMSSTAR